MPLFERPLAFRSSPLLPTVPLDGTQTVTGLRELERQSRLQAPQRHSRLAQPATSSNTRRTRYGGPHVWELRPEALWAPPRDWERFAHDGQLAEAYNVPDSMDMLGARLDENIAFFLSNYTRVALTVLGVIGYLNPKAVVAIVVLCATALLNLRIKQTATTPIPENLQLLQSFSWIAAFVAVMWGRCLSALLRWSVYASLLVLLHGGLRRAQSEVGAGAVPGVTFRQVLGLDKSHPDPRRLFNELWHVAWTWLQYWAWSARAWCRQQLYLATGSLQHLQRRAPAAETYLS